MTPYPKPVPALPHQSRQEARDYLRLALRDWLPMSGGLSLEALIDRLEGRA